MLEPSELQAAVAAGVLDVQQAERLSAFLAARGGTVETADPDHERFRLIGGFNDIFVTIGIALIFGALAALMIASPGLFPYIGAALAWGLAEVFTLRRRMALPSIVLAVLFAVLVAASAYLPFASATRQTVVPVFGVLAGIGAGAHYARFRVPIDIALTASAAVYFMFALLVFPSPDMLAYSGHAALAMGLAVFACAMYFDLSDPARRTHRGDIAFWLHMLAAPLIVHGIFAGVIGASRFSGEHAGAVLAATLMFVLVALVIDRRAMIVAALTYAGGALYYFVKGAGTVADTAALCILLLGGGILLLSIGWRWLRALIVPRLPLGAFAARLPPVHAA